MKPLLVPLLLLPLSGCSLLEPAGRIELAYGDIHYTSTKDVDVTFEKNADGSVSVTVSSSATNPMTVQSQTAATQAEVMKGLLDRVPLK